MLVVMNSNASEKDIQRVALFLESKGFPMYNMPNLNLRSEGSKSDACLFFGNLEKKKDF